MVNVKLPILYTPERITNLTPGQIFVFGSNTRGIHGAGAALVALRSFGAIPGQASGLQGQSYGIITKDLDLGERSIPFEQLQSNISEFVSFARMNDQYEFLVTAIGCGLSGYTPKEVAPMFFDDELFPQNVRLPQVFWDVVLSF